MKLSEINVYPIKSLGGISLTEAKVEERGLEFDRRWMIVDGEGTFLTQRQIPKMATLRIELRSDGLQINDRTETLFVPYEPTSSEKIEVKVQRSVCEAVLYDEQVNAWFSESLQTACRLVKMPEATSRLVNPLYAVRKFKDRVSFADGYPFMLIGKNSLADLNSRLEKPLPMNRFRPNFVIEGSESYAEDGWKKVCLGETVFYIVKPCSRCVITTVDQTSGVFDGSEPLKVLAKYRLAKHDGKNEVDFGQYLIAENFGKTVRLGDELKVF